MKPRITDPLPFAVLLVPKGIFEQKNPFELSIIIVLSNLVVDVLPGIFKVCHCESGLLLHSRLSIHHKSAVPIISFQPRIYHVTLNCPQYKRTKIRRILMGNFDTWLWGIHQLFVTNKIVPPSAWYATEFKVVSRFCCTYQLHALVLHIYQWASQRHFVLCYICGKRE